MLRIAVGYGRKNHCILRLIAHAFLCVCLFSTTAAIAQDAAEDQPPPSLENFLGGVDLQGVSFSPNGHFIAAIRIEDRQHMVSITDVGSGQMRAQSMPLGVAAIDWVEWVDDNRLLLRTTLNVDFVAQDEKLYQALMRGRATYLPTLMTFEVDSQSLKKLTPGGYVRFAASNQGQITDFLPNDPDHVLLTANLDSGNDLFKLNIRDGRIWRVAEGSNNTYAWATDRNGRPVFRFNTNSRGSVIEIFVRQDRENGKIAWRKIKKIRLNRDESNLAAPEFDVLYPGPTANTYYVAARPEGADTTAVYLYDIENDQFLEKINAQDTFDVQYALFNKDTRELEGVYYYDDKLVVEMLNPELQSSVDKVNTLLGEDVNVLPIDRSKAGNSWLFLVSGPSDFGSYYVYDSDSESLRLFGHRKNSLAANKMANMEVIDFTARDGLALKGYLTRPNALGAGGKPPLIMLPHGGPEARDVYGFDLDVQVLVSKGYQVFQPNFRGSSGFGLAFADKGRRQWGKAMQTDIDDAYEHLVASGIVDSGNACIYGNSYGGYAALAAATLSPDTYRCIISGAGPSDLVKMLKWERKEEGGNSKTYEYWVNHIGDPKSQSHALNAVSPARLADRIKVPVLLIHGEEDGVVPIEQSELMEKAMKKAKKDVRFVRLEESGHTYRSDEDEEREYLEILNFLARHLPVSQSRPTNVEIATEQVATSVPVGAEPVE
tara:strand:+ start:150 stop:2294 length:2145 start_codon:yes stop_codon:yes gene_type:complete